MLAAVVAVYPAVSSNPVMLEAPLYNRSITLALPVCLPTPTTFANTRILLDALLGVMFAVKPVDTKVEVEVLTSVA